MFCPPSAFQNRLARDYDICFSITVHSRSMYMRAHACTNVGAFCCFPTVAPQRLIAPFRSSSGRIASDLYASARGRGLQRSDGQVCWTTPHSHNALDYSIVDPMLFKQVPAECARARAMCVCVLERILGSMKRGTNLRRGDCCCCCGMCACVYVLYPSRTQHTTCSLSTGMRKHFRTSAGVGFLHAPSCSEA